MKKVQQILFASFRFLLIYGCEEEPIAMEKVGSDESNDVATGGVFNVQRYVVI